MGPYSGYMPKEISKIAEKNFQVLTNFTNI